MFAYCNNNPPIASDSAGKRMAILPEILFLAPIKIIGQGWSYRIDKACTSTMTKRHIHIFHKKKEYIQNEDGSGHDGFRAETGEIPDWVNEFLKEKENWDYNGNRESFYNKTTVTYRDDGAKIYSFADGTTKTKQPVRAYGLIMPERIATVDDLETIYCSSNTNSNWTTNNTTTVPIPLLPSSPLSFPDLMPFSIPVFGF